MDKLLYGEPMMESLECLDNLLSWKGQLSHPLAPLFPGRALNRSLVLLSVVICLRGRGASKLCAAFFPGVPFSGAHGWRIANPRGHDTADPIPYPRREEACVGSPVRSCLAPVGTLVANQLLLHPPRSGQLPEAC